MKTAMAALVAMFIAGFALPASAGDCKRVQLKVKNGGAKMIKALKLDYMSEKEMMWRTEDFTNKNVHAGKIRTVSKKLVLKAIEGHNMKSIKLYFKTKCNGKWSVTKTFTKSQFPKPKCISNAKKSYRVDLPASAVGC